MYFYKVEVAIFKNRETIEQSWFETVNVIAHSLLEARENAINKMKLNSKVIALLDDNSDASVRVYSIVRSSQVYK